MIVHSRTHFINILKHELVLLALGLVHLSLTSATKQNQLPNHFIHCNMHILLRGNGFDAKCQIQGVLQERDDYCVDVAKINLLGDLKFQSYRNR